MSGAEPVLRVIDPCDEPVVHRWSRLHDYMEVRDTLAPFLYCDDE